jgi:hypothetical protein
LCGGSAGASLLPLLLVRVQRALLLLQQQLLRVTMVMVVEVVLLQGNISSIMERQQQQQQQQQQMQLPGRCHRCCSSGWQLVAYCKQAKVLLLILMGQQGGQLALAAALLLLLPLLLGKLMGVSQMCLLQLQKQPVVVLSRGLLLVLLPLLEMLQPVKEAKAPAVNSMPAAAAVVAMRGLQTWKLILAVVLARVTVRTTC